MKWCVWVCAMCLCGQPACATLFGGSPGGELDLEGAAGAARLRLPQDVKPLAYTLELSVLPQREVFSGRTQISVELLAPRREVWLHGQRLQVKEVRAVSEDEVTSGRYKQHDAAGLASIEFERELPAGKYVIELQYEAAFDRKLLGLYRVDVGRDSYAFTQFEPLSARRAFPCFDEPGWKTPFDIWLTVAEADAAVSNTLPIGFSHSGDYKRIHFAPTQPLPTYLVAWAVGPFDIVDGADLPPTTLRARTLPVRGIAPRGRGSLIGAALSSLGPIITTLEQYLGVAFPYEKLDIVAVPDFGAGAMENAGLVTFRDSLLLLNPKLASDAERRNRQLVIAHELAHQWFGDLVTMAFWDDLWLNEAFATWFEYSVTDKLMPSYRADLAQVASAHAAMVMDSRVIARSVRQPIGSTHDIENAFDAITYNKGAAILVMLERYLGKRPFQQGLQAYLKEHAFGNATTEDLIDALSRHAGHTDVAGPLDSFVSQAGAPLVFSELECRAGQTARLRVHQERYLPLGSAGKPDQSWQLPLCVRYEIFGVTSDQCALISTPDATVELEQVGCPSWLMPNADGAGYYYVQPAAAELSALLEHGLPKLNAKERYALLSSVIAGFEAGAVSADQLLGALPDFALDSARPVAMAPLPLLTRLHDHYLPRISPESERERREAEFSSYVRNLYGATAKRLGTSSPNIEPSEVSTQRAQVLAAMCDLANDDGLRRELARLGAQYLGLDGDGRMHPESVASGVEELAVRMLVEQGDQATWQAVYDRLIASQDAIMRRRYLNALSSVRDARAEKALALTLDPALRVNERLIPLSRQLADPRTRAAAYTYFERHFDELAQRLSPAAMGGTPQLTASFCDRAAVPRVLNFFRPRIEKLPGGPRSLGGALESIELCDALFAQQSAALSAFFSK